jgi:hypothetical protein
MCGFNHHGIDKERNDYYLSISGFKTGIGRLYSVSRACPVSTAPGTDSMHDTVSPAGYADKD